MIIHSADFIGGAKPFEISQQWSKKVNQEFAAQVTLESFRSLLRFSACCFRATSPNPRFVR